MRPALLALAAALPLGCTVHASQPGAEIRYGSGVPVGHGHARTYVIVSSSGIDEVGVALSEDALQGLPAQGGHQAGAAEGHPDRDDEEYLLEMPSGARTLYRFVELSWNPSGHPPQGIYDQPHFDVHFYTIPLDARNDIDPGHKRFRQRANRLPDSTLVPAGYLPHHLLEGVEPAEVTVPRMGMHWLDPASPEFHGERFTATMLYGSWDGRFVFEEPMVSRAFLLERPDFALPLPAHPSGGSPRTLRVYWDGASREYRIALRDLEAPGFRRSLQKNPG